MSEVTCPVCGRSRDSKFTECTFCDWRYKVVTVNKYSGVKANLNKT